MAELCRFGKEIKKKLVDIDQTQIWLIERVRQDTGKYFDGWYLHRILTGNIATPSMVTSICKILDLPIPKE
nr:MAG TPA: hypothetical protein [Caudoviricetes sp.]